MANSGKSAAKTIAALFITIVILMGATYAFTVYLVPYLNLTDSDIIEILKLMLVVLVALLLLQLGAALGRREDRETVREIRVEVPVKTSEVRVVEKVKEEESEETVYLSIRDALTKEIESALISPSDLTIVSVPRVSEQAVLNTVGADTLSFDDGNKTYVILPFFNKNEALRACAALSPIKASTLSGRNIDADTFISEV